MYHWLGTAKLTSLLRKAEKDASSEAEALREQLKEAHSCIPLTKDQPYGLYQNHPTDYCSGVTAHLCSPLVEQGTTALLCLRKNSTIWALAPLVEQHVRHIPQ